MFIGGAILMGVGAGSFLAVDWALMTEIIPKASSGSLHGHLERRDAPTNGVDLGAFIGAASWSMPCSSSAGRSGPRAARWPSCLAPVVVHRSGALLLRPSRRASARLAGRVRYSHGMNAQR